MIWKLLILFSLTGTTVCLMCYQCSDTTDDERKNQCQTYIRTMSKKQGDWLKDGKLRPYIKNCSDFGDLEEEDIYCHIVSLRRGGTGALLTYIRDCSNGHHFFGADFNSLFTTGNVLPDNQTTCMYSPQGYLACVTLCGPNEDFCNGPKADANSNTVSMIMIVTILVGALWKCHC